ncbi:M23 family metallopeptidase [Microbacterium sp. NPDC089695]|uniref:M23 family metallopeptidase n=1 Tax=Microbacterium sp. NPDC089695 TaxID=3364198 RepID=UPI0038081972
MRLRLYLAALLLLAFVLLVAAPRATAAAPVDPAPAPVPEDAGWTWPVDGPHRVTESFRAPAHAYGAGHRGIDIEAPIGSDVRAPADGVVMFRGTVVDRDVLSIQHSGGLVSSYEPLVSDLAVGTVVAAGDRIGVVAHGGHTAPGALHLGVRLDDAYIDPLLLFGPVPRAVLLPCCASG